MIKVGVFLTLRPDLTHEQFSQCWKDEHASLLMSLDAITSQVRHFTQQHSLNNVPGGFPILPYDGVAELWFDNLSSAMTTFGHQDYPSTVAKDEEHFLDRTKTVMFDIGAGTGALSLQAAALGASVIAISSPSFHAP